MKINIGFTCVHRSLNWVICNVTIVVNNGLNFFRWSHGGVCGMSGNNVSDTNRVLFCENVIVCDMLSNGEIIYRMRKFSTRVR